MKFLLKHKKFTGSIIFTYDDKERITGFQFDCDVTDELFEFIMNYFPQYQSSLKNKAYKNFEVIQVLSDMSFTAFWETYNYKVGNKKRSEKLWNLLSEHDRAQVFAGIRRYDLFMIRKPNQDKCYPETFLSQRRWENSFE